ncbi:MULTISPECIES: site-specific integrase [unclassified Shinella]|uniref:tyrosine-type recombinase/integrase n=1 Tax=unclassified Shinella TaxID=2643062 RepID=UPI00225DB5FE|nr:MULTISPECIES: site-specific integrase [unclassified Shinella]MCO5139270.1 tyrosine-type recombinase/integrase [Shinella sp.]MDC7256001.1 tyrosine-type recombinase/integrase [Shinella sp. YE25]CAI0338837.1 Integrase [Rhizobiaceae bacterium]CAK7257265.1 Integrase [Shinella sp. WSC3-e]
MPKLTKTMVETAEPKAKQYSLWCGELAGFGVYVNPTGSRTYFVDYRNADGERRRMTIGRHGKITTEEARKLAIASLGSTVRGEDPQKDRTTRRKSLTVKQLCEQYMEAARKGVILGKGGKPKKATTIYVDQGRINRHIVPLLGSKLVIDLTTPMVTKMMRDVTNGKTATTEKTAKLRGKAVVEGGPGTARQTVSLMSGILSYAVSEGIIDQNPARGIKKPAVGKRDRRLSPDEYRALGTALATAEAEAELPQAIAGTWLIALTGCRFGEVQALKWSEVDFDGKALRLEDSKTGASVRPLSQAAIEVLEKIDRTSDNIYVLPAARKTKGHYGSLDTAVDRIVARAELTGVTSHTLRHSFASVGDDLGFTENTIGAIIGHKGQTVTSRYIHKLDSVLIAAANKIGGEVHRQMTGIEATVVQMPLKKSRKR